MLRTVLSLIVIAVLAAPSAFSAGVTGIQLDYENSNTVATIQVSGPVQVAHQTVEAKDGKPFRVIVDLVASVHQLGAMSFGDLPPCPIQTIRTSQYSVDPERVVRIVFDMNGETIYRVDAAGNQVKVFFPDPSGKPFTTWTSRTHVPAKPAAPAQAKPATVARAEQPKAEKPNAAGTNKKIEQDRQASLTAADPAPKQAAKPKAEPQAQPKVAAAPQPQTTKSATVQLKPGQVYGPTAHPEVLAEVRKEEARKQAEAARYAELAKAQAKTTAAPEKPQPTPAPAQVQPKPAEQPRTLATTQQPAPKQEPDAPETSRFRRTPARSKQIAGTMVVEFPKRLTIKYGAGRDRDPFETLINDSKTYDGPVHERVPNVEALRLVGVIESPDPGNRALFQDKDGYGYILKSGDKVERGVVLRVEADRVYFQIFEYGWSRTVALRLDSE